jgi:hypothetical protein
MNIFVIFYVGWIQSEWTAGSQTERFLKDAKFENIV